MAEPPDVTNSVAGASENVVQAHTINGPVTVGSGNGDLDAALAVYRQAAANGEADAVRRLVRKLREHNRTEEAQAWLIRFPEIADAPRSVVPRVVATHGNRRRVLSASIPSIAFSPDGSLLALSSVIWQRVEVLNTATMRPAMPYIKTPFLVTNAVAFSSDGQLLATAGDSGKIALWNPANGEQVRKLTGHRESVSALAFSPDGSLLASGSHDNTVRLWNPGTGDLIGELAGHSSAINALAFSPDSTLLASGADDSTARLWNPATRTLAFPRLIGHGGVVGSLAFSPDGSVLATANFSITASGGGAVRFWDPATGALTGPSVAVSARGVESIAFRPDGRLLAAGCRDGRIRLVDPIGRRLLEPPITGHGRSVEAVAFSPDGRLLASASEDNTLRIWSDVYPDTA